MFSAFPSLRPNQGKNQTHNYYQLLSESCGNLPASWLVGYYGQMKNWRNSINLCVLLGWSLAFYWPGGFLALILAETSLSLEHAWILKILTEKCDSGVQDV